MSKKATTEDNIGYTSGMCEKKGFKLNPDWVEFGERMKQGDRTDLEEFRDEVRGGMSLYNAYENHISIMARYPYLYTAIQSVTPPHNDKPIVKLYWGRSGTGKTTLALSEGCIEVTYDGRYFSGCHDKMVINELHPNQFDRSLFLRITDEHPTPVRLLGSYAQWHPKLLIFTSNFSPDNLFSLDEAYLRRFAEMRHFESPYW